MVLMLSSHWQWHTAICITHIPLCQTTGAQRSRIFNSCLPACCRSAGVGHIEKFILIKDSYFQSLLAQPDNEHVPQIWLDIPRTFPDHKSLKSQKG